MAWSMIGLSSVAGGNLLFTDFWIVLLAPITLTIKYLAALTMSLSPWLAQRSELVLES